MSGRYARRSVPVDDDDDDDEDGDTKMADVKGFGPVPDDLTPSTQDPPTLVLENLLRPDPATLPTQSKPVNEKELWPAQFQTKFYKKAGFIYKMPPELASLDKRRITKGSLKSIVRFTELKDMKTGPKSR